MIYITATRKVQSVVFFTDRIHIYFLNFSLLFLENIE